MITGLNHVTLSVGDLDRSLAFYAELLGFRVEARWNQGVYLSAGDLWLCLALGEPAPAADYSHMAFSVDADLMENLVVRLPESDVRCWQPNTSEGESFYCLDPDGHQLELHNGTLATRLAAVDQRPYAGWHRFEEA